MSRRLDFLRRNRRLYTMLRNVRMSYRRWYYGLKHIHSTVYIAAGCHISSDLIAREYGFVNTNCILGPKVELGPYVMLAPHVAVVGADHRFDIPGTPIIFSGRDNVPKTMIEADAWVGHGAILIAGVHIGRGAIIGAGSVVTKDVPPYEIHAGVPARKIGDRFHKPEAREEHDRMLSRPPVAGDFCRPTS